MLEGELLQRLVVEESSYRRVRNPSLVDTTAKRDVSGGAEVKRGDQSGSCAD